MHEKRRQIFMASTTKIPLRPVRPTHPRNMNSFVPKKGHYASVPWTNIGGKATGVRGEYMYAIEGPPSPRPIVHMPRWLPSTPGERSVGLGTNFGLFSKPINGHDHPLPSGMIHTSVLGMTHLSSSRAALPQPSQLSQSLSQSPCPCFSTLVSPLSHSLSPSLRLLSSSLSLPFSLPQPSILVYLPPFLPPSAFYSRLSASLGSPSQSFLSSSLSLGSPS